MPIYKFTIPFKLVSKKNSRPIFKNKKTGKMFIGKSNKLSSFEEAAALTLRTQKSAQKLDMIEEKIIIRSIVFEFEKSRRQDLDNILTSVLDLLQDAQIIKNDKQVVAIKNVSFLENMGRVNTTIEIETLKKHIPTTVKQQVDGIFGS